MAEIVMQSLKHINILKHITLGLLSVIGSVIILTLTIPQGAGMTPDSVVYISVARNLAGDMGFLTYNGTDLVLQPPLYPIILAFIKILTLVDPQVSTGYLNAVLFGVIIYLFGLLLLKYLKSFALIILGTISVVISYALVQSSLMILSEPLFILLVLLSLYYADKFRSNQNYLSLFLLSILTSLACLTRYTGVILILIGMIVILFQQNGNLKKKFIQSLIFLLITLLPIGSWVIRNISISGSPLGQRAKSSYTLLQNLGFFYDTLLPWYLPANSISTYLILLTFLSIGWILFKLNFVKPFRFNIVDKIIPSILFVIFYSCIIIVSSTTTAYDRISDRLLSPIYIPSVFIIFFILDKIYNWLTIYFNKKAISIFLTICIMSLLRFPLHNTLYIIQEFRSQSGNGYNRALWGKSETIEYLIKHKLFGSSFTLYSNDPEAVYAFTNLKTEYSPAKTFYNSPQLVNEDQNKINIYADDKERYLIWFNKANRSFLFTIDELRKNFDMTEVASFEDGEIYTFK